jgi:hypothetical protein
MDLRSGLRIGALVPDGLRHCDFGVDGCLSMWKLCYGESRPERHDTIRCGWARGRDVIEGRMGKELLGWGKRFNEILIVQVEVG